jgi:hypothetical protein
MGNGFRRAVPSPHFLGVCWWRLADSRTDAGRWGDGGADGPGGNASTLRPDVRLQPTGTSHEAKMRGSPGPGGYRSIFSETQTQDDMA